mgnify:CR=1 FL=1
MFVVNDTAMAFIPLKFKFPKKDSGDDNKNPLNYSRPSFFNDFSQRFRNLTSLFPKINFTVLLDVHD